jgi:predicted RNA-binding Zn-ribbon protein involved in translation (DUF1610 family)
MFTFTSWGCRVGIADRLETAMPTRQPQDVNVNISLDAERGAVSEESEPERRASDTVSEDGASDVSHGRGSRKTPSETGENADTEARRTCAQCGDEVSSSHVYCPNCGEKASRRVFCDCGDELRSDWGFCPSCGRRTPAADVLEGSRSGVNRE